MKADLTKSRQLRVSNVKKRIMSKFNKFGKARSAEPKAELRAAKHSLKKNHPTVYKTLKKANRWSAGGRWAGAIGTALQIGSAIASIALQIELNKAALNLQDTQDDLKRAYDILGNCTQTLSEINSLKSRVKVINPITCR